MRSAQRFRHEAMFYSGLDGFLDGTLPFVRDAVSNDEPVLVVVGNEKIDLLRRELGNDAKHVDFADMAQVGHNPARIIPAWYDFVAERATEGRRIRGIGEPIHPERNADALVECQRHESLLNLAFADASTWWLRCPYDTTALDTDVIDEALRSHPYVIEAGEQRASPEYRDVAEIAQPFDLPLSEPRGDIDEMTFTVEQLDEVRRRVYVFCAMHGLSDGRNEDLVLAVNEVATNSLRHGGGRGALRLWRESNSLLCEVQDGGLIDVPLAGRQRPIAGQEGGFGLWLVQQVCDLVQMRTFPEGNVVRLHMYLT